MVYCIVIFSNHPVPLSKEGSTSHPSSLQWSLHPLLFPYLCGGTETSGAREETALQCYICPTCPSPAGGSLTHSQALALSKRARDVTAPSRCSEPLRSKVGGASKPSPSCAGWDRLGKACFNFKLAYFSIGGSIWDRLEICFNRIVF